MQKRYGIGVAIIPIIILLLVVGIWIMVAFSPSSSPLEVEKFEINPSQFKTTESAELALSIKNLSDKRLDVRVHFETNEKVQIYLGENLLPRSGCNYTFSTSLDPKETSTKRFTVKAGLDVGEQKEDYYIKAFVYADDRFVSSKKVIFTVERSD